MEKRKLIIWIILSGFHHFHGMKHANNVSWTDSAIIGLSTITHIPELIRYDFKLRHDQ